jgi:type I restriction enzyme R subunit
VAAPERTRLELLARQRLVRHTYLSALSSMSPSDYTEELLVEQPAIRLFSDLGWETVSATDEIFGFAEPSPRPSPSGRGSWLGRETKSEVVLLPKLRLALDRLNPRLPAEAISFAISEFARDRSAMSLAAASREVWELLRDGVKVLVPDRERGGLKTEKEAGAVTQEAA